MQRKDDTVDKACWLRFRKLRLSLNSSVGFLFSTELEVNTDTLCYLKFKKSQESAVKLFHSIKSVERGHSSIKKFKVVEYDLYNPALMLGKL